jgi:hypothetical protein
MAKILNDFVSFEIQNYSINDRYQINLKWKRIMMNDEKYNPNIFFSF